MTVIIVKATGSRGKTETLKELIELLKNENGEFIINEKDPNGKDFFAILEWNDRKIGIITQGDPGTEWHVKECLSKCIENNVDFIVAASRTRYTPDSVYNLLWNFIHDHNAKGIETSTIVKYDGWGLPVDETILNKICAENLLNIIRNINEDK